MKTSDLNTIGVAHHCCAFLDLNDRALTPLNSSRARTDVDAILASLARARDAQADATIHARALTATRQELRRRLRLAMLPIVTLGRMHLGIGADVIGLVMPPTGASAGELLVTARKTAELTRGHAEALIRLGLPSSAFDDLRSFKERYAAVHSECWSHEEHRSGLTAMIADDMSALRAAVRALDSLVLSRLATHECLTAQWRAIRAGKAVTISRSAA